jgi:hypothetical protein
MHRSKFTDFCTMNHIAGIEHVIFAASARRQENFITAATKYRHCLFFRVYMTIEQSAGIIEIKLICVFLPVISLEFAPVVNSVKLKIVKIIYWLVLLGAAIVAGSTFLQAHPESLLSADSPRRTGL